MSFMRAGEAATVSPVDRARLHEHGLQNLGGMVSIRIVKPASTSFLSRLEQTDY
ncbi:MAG: hypothetical protein GX797_06540 [Chloroflexi bacterium]|nr:hypothetical protein [Chloroflexota bacterium]